MLASRWLISYQRQLCCCSPGKGTKGSSTWYVITTAAFIEANGLALGKAAQAYAKETMPATHGVPVS